MRRSVITVSTKAPGGIRAVVENYQQSEVFAGYESHWLASHEEGSIPHRVLVFLRCLARLLYLRIRGHRLYHLHMAMKGSLYRKWILVSLLKASRATVILHLHGSEFDQYHENASAPVRWVLRQTLRRADTVVVLSRKWQDTVSGIDSAIRSRVIYNSAACFTSDQTDPLCAEASERGTVVDTEVSTSTTDRLDPGALVVLPNPAVDAIQVIHSATTAGEGRLLVFDLTGHLLHGRRIGVSEGVNQYGVRIDGLPSGMYLIRVETPAGWQTQKFIKE